MLLFNSSTYTMLFYLLSGMYVGIILPILLLSQEQNIEIIYCK